MLSQCFPSWFLIFSNLLQKIIQINWFLCPALLGVMKFLGCFVSLIFSKSWLSNFPVALGVWPVFAVLVVDPPLLVNPNSSQEHCQAKPWNAAGSKARRWSEGHVVSVWGRSGTRWTDAARHPVSLSVCLGSNTPSVQTTHRHKGWPVPKIYCFWLWQS